MREIVSSVTSKGQVTIPVEVRRLLGVKPRDKVSFLVDGDKVRITRRESVVARTAGIFKSNKPTATIEEMRESFERGVAEEVVKRVGASGASTA